MECEVCGRGPGFPGEINTIPLVMCMSCLRMASGFESSNLKIQIASWLWRRRVLRKFNAPLALRIRARTKWLEAKRALEEKERRKKEKKDLWMNMQVQNLLKFADQISRREI
jgi:hypothetical protein